MNEEHNSTESPREGGQHTARPRTNNVLGLLSALGGVLGGIMIAGIALWIGIAPGLSMVLLTFGAVAGGLLTPLLVSKCRRFQFSLRTMFVATAVVAIVLAQWPPMRFLVESRK